MGSVHTMKERLGSPSESSSLLPIAHQIPQSQNDPWGVRRVAQLTYHAAFIALSIYFFIHIYKGSDSGSDSSNDSQYSSNFRLESKSVSVDSGALPQKPYIFHVPKTASTYYIELIRYVCKDVGVYENITWLMENDPWSINAYINLTPDVQWCLRNKFGKSDMWHSPVTGEQWTRNSGTFVGMFRHPTARIASAFAHEFHDCGGMQASFKSCFKKRHDAQKVDPDNWKALWLKDVPPEEQAHCSLIEDPTLEIVKQFFNCVKGCAGSMLLGVRCGDGMYWQENGLFGGDIVRPNYQLTESEVEVAMGRLERFSAVGIMEEYSESVARLHKIYNGTVAFSARTMLPNVRPSEDSGLKDKVKKLIVANGLVDHVDERVWNRAREMFHSQPNVLDK
mmetsp:Transcript_6974/g.12053  ORF Transcript_6974/g.12053 Transcript_6974/m.12053 type:complete len:393 (-) Transcript_6974:970-2148(-)